MYHTERGTGRKIQLIWAKTFRTPSDTLLAAADEELIGRELRDGKFKLKVSESFYKDILIEERILKDLLSLCSVANLVGERCVEIAMELGYISRENILYIEGVPHAQFSIME
jgi:hypothetical protein